jgi:hypothetical protein
VSLDEQHFTCDTGNIFAKADEVRNDKASFFFVPEPKRNEHPIAELSSFNQLMSALNMSVLICNKLILIHEQIIENDLVAREIFNKYTHSLESKIKEIDVSAFEGLSMIGIQDSSVEKLIKDSIEFLKQFISKVDSDSVWFLSSGRIKDVSIQLNETKIYAQMQLLHAINEYSY